jgi:hypothetical protein
MIPGMFSQRRRGGVGAVYNAHGPARRDIGNGEHCIPDRVMGTATAPALNVITSATCPGIGL